LKALRNDEIIYVFGDLQDTPDISKIFYYVASKVSKHPLGIVKICEDLGLECTTYYHMDNMAKPIISRHGAKGGRFLEGMYVCQRGISCILGITIVQDTGFMTMT